MAKRKRKKSTCHSAGLKSNGRLRKGFRWAKGRKRCAIPARKSRKGC